MLRVNICGGCYKRETIIENEKSLFKLCSRCRGTYYCSTACQSADWPNHRVYCTAQTTDIKAKDLRPIIYLINSDVEYKMMIVKLLDKLPENNYLNVELTEEQIRASPDMQAYRRGKITTLETTPQSQMYMVYDSRYFFQLFVTHGNIDLSVVLARNGKTKIEAVVIKDCEIASIHFFSDAESPTIADQPKFAKTLSKPTGSVYYRSKSDGRLYHLLFGVADTATEN